MNTKKKNTKAKIIEGIICLLLGVFLLWGLVESNSFIGSSSKMLFQSMVAGLFAFLGPWFSKTVGIIITILLIVWGLECLNILSLLSFLEKIPWWQFVQKKSKTLSIFMDAFLYLIIFLSFQFIWTYFLFGQTFFQEICFYLPAGFLVVYLYSTKRHKPVANMFAHVLFFWLMVSLTIKVIT